MSKTVRSAGPEDKELVLELLREADLPQQGLFEKTAVVLVVEIDRTVSGSAALEIEATDGLLRSVVVSSEQRGRGIGKLLVQEIEMTALQLGLGRLYLLTTTAEQFFKQLAYEIVEREDVADVVRNSDEFSFCSSVGATVMCKYLRGNKPPHLAN